MKKLALILLIAVTAALAVTSTPAYVPNSDTTITTAGVILRGLHLNNKSGSSSDCVLKDRSTNCGGGACSIWGPATLGASGSSGSVVSWVFPPDTIAPSGIQWSCTTASSVVGIISYSN